MLKNRAFPDSLDHLQFWNDDRQLSLATSLYVSLCLFLFSSLYRGSLLFHPSHSATRQSLNNSGRNFCIPSQIFLSRHSLIIFALGTTHTHTHGHTHILYSNINFSHCLSQIPKRWWTSELSPHHCPLRSYPRIQGRLPFSIIHTAVSLHPHSLACPFVWAELSSFYPET